MRGCLPTESTATRWRRRAGAAQLRMLLTSAAVGALAGLICAHARLHLGLPGHKALLWLAPIVAARLLGRHPVGATAGASAAACASLASGGNLAGGAMFLPLVALAGAVLDAIVAFAERWRLGPWRLIPLLGLGGLAANLLCAVKRLLVPLRAHHLILGISGPFATVLSYAFFGLLAGLIGAGVAASVSTAVSKRRTG